MRIYKVTMDMLLVMPRLKHISLGEFNGNRPIIFVEAEDPDDACYQSYHKLAAKLMKQDKKLVKDMKDIFNYITIKKIEMPK